MGYKLFLYPLSNLWFSISARYPKYTLYDILKEFLKVALFVLSVNPLANEKFFR